MSRDEHPASHTSARTPSARIKNIGVLISGRGSNLGALIDAIGAGTLAAQIPLVISNRPDAPGLALAQAAGIETRVINHKDFDSREAFDREIARALKSRGVELVCLAGFMRLVGAALLEAFPNAILNIHPSLLPAFPGVDAQRQALEHGVRVSGATVHLVTGELDGGPIVMQAAVPVLPDDTEASLSARILEQEHRLYPASVALILSGKWRVEDRRIVLTP